MESVYSHDKKRNKTNTDEWLENRFSLFERYCFPSIKNQSNTNYIWFVLFDSQTPIKYRKLIDGYQQLLPQFVPLYFSDEMYPDMRQAICKAMLDYVQEDDQFVITTRIDNDDAFHKNMIKEVQSRFDKQNDIFLNFNNGLQYDVDNNILARIKYINNHFISRIEKRNSGVKTVIDYNHAFINEVGAVVYIENKEPLWIEIVHDRNISNKFNPDAAPTFNSREFSTFGFSAKISTFRTLAAIHTYKKRVITYRTGTILKKIRLYYIIRHIYRLLK